MSLKERIKSAGFWAGLMGAVFLMLGAFGVEVGEGEAQTAINAVSSLLTVLGVISSGKPGKTEQSGQTETGEDVDPDAVVAIVQTNGDGE